MRIRKKVGPDAQDDAHATYKYEQTRILIMFMITRGIKGHFGIYILALTRLLVANLFS